MFSVSRSLIACAVAAAIPALAAAQSPSTSQPVHSTAAVRVQAQAPRAAGVSDVAKAATESAEAKSCADPWRPAADSPYFFEWQAQHNLDCIIAAVDEHLTATPAHQAASEGDVAVPREQLERLRMMAVAALDASMRVGK